MSSIFSARKGQINHDNQNANDSNRRGGAAMTVEMAPRDIEPGTLIGYHPLGNEDVRQTGVVDRHYGGNVDIGVVVTLPDDPGIEERVRYEHIEAVEDE